MTPRYALPLTAREYQTLINYVRRAIVMRTNGSATAIPDQHYGSLDAFHEANRMYSRINACNTWTGTALRDSGVKVSRWTPLDSMVVWHLQKP